MANNWLFGIPAFNMTQRFVYLQDLCNTENNASYLIKWAKENLYAQASSAAASIGYSIGGDDHTIINNALDFLLSVANSERAKELAVISDYKKSLHNNLPKEDKTIQRLLNKINDGSLLEDPKLLSKFYTALTSYINKARTSVKKYEQQLETLRKHLNTEMKDLAKDDYRFRAAGDIQALLNNLIGMATRTQEKKENSYANKIRQTAKEYIIKSGLLNRLKSADDVAAAFAAVSLDIQQQMQDELDRTQKKDLADLTKETDNIFQQIADKYLEAEIDSQSNLQLAINNNQAELDTILKATKDILNIKVSNDASFRKHREEKVSSRIKNIKNSNSLYKQLKEESGVDDIVDNLKYVEFNVGSSTTAHGNIFELIHIISEGNTIKVTGNAGTDTIHLGSIVFNTLTPDIQKEFLPILQRMNKALTTYTQATQKDRKEDRTQAFQRMNEEIEAVKKALDDKIKEFEIPMEDLFVYHESLKLYKTAETNNLESFHGRDLTILSFLDELYTMNGMANLTLPHKDSLTFLALNLSNFAVGGSLKGTLAEYLSIFAGMIMFDDLQSIAYDAMNRIQGTSTGITKQIHLYNLNGIYVPASMLLTFTYTAMKQFSDQITRGYAARASINTSAADAAIAQYLHDRPVPLRNQWSILGNAVSSGTNIRITFLASFNELLKNLGV